MSAPKAHCAQLWFLEDAESYDSHLRYYTPCLESCPVAIPLYALILFE